MGKKAAVPAVTFNKGDMVKFKRGNIMVTGKVKQILPSGALEINTDQYGLYTRKASDVRIAGKREVKVAAITDRKLHPARGIKANANGKTVAAKPAATTKPAAKPVNATPVATDRRAAALKAWETIRAKRAAAARA
jgi:hypothetical protein